MATDSTFYIDTSLFSTATAVWSDAPLTIKGADGWYQAPVEGTATYREQSSGVLGVATSCVCGTYIGVGTTNIGGGADSFVFHSIGPSTGTPPLTTTPANILATGYGGGATGAPSGTSFTATYKFFGDFDANPLLTDHAVTINRLDASWISILSYDTTPDSITIVAGTSNSYIEGDIAFDINATITGSTTSSDLGFTGTDTLIH